MCNQPKGIEPGIYLNLDYNAYRADPAISCSDIKNLLVSPLKYWVYSCLNPDGMPSRNNTKETKFGRDVHCYLLERDRFLKEYMVIPDKLLIDSEFYRSESKKPDFSANFELYKTKEAKTFKYIGNKENILSEKDYSKIVLAIESVESNPVASELFKDGESEVSIFWQDPDTNLMCKARLDYLAANYIADYKSVANIDNIVRDMANYQYYLQAAYYLRGINNLKPDANYQRFIFAFQEKEEPYLVRLKEFSQEVIEESNRIIDRGLDIYKNNIEKYGLNKWHDDYKKPDEHDIVMIGFEDMPSYVQYNIFLNKTI